MADGRRATDRIRAAGLHVGGAAKPWGTVLTKRAHILAILVALSAFNQLDRQLTSVLLEPIRLQFALSDFQLGLLSGFAFAALFAGLSIPSAILAAYANRRNLIAASAAVWGGMTVLSGLAPSYAALLTGRIGVGIGEAGMMPASHGVISDLYGPHERSGALAAWSSGVNIGIFLAFLLGGVVGQAFGWRAAFVSAGLATTIMAALAARVAEPARAALAASAASRGAQSWGLVAAAARRMASDGPVRHILIGSTLTAIAAYGDVAWSPSFFERVHGLSLTTTGVFLALVVGVGGGLAVVVGGGLMDRLQRIRPGAGFLALALAYAVTKPFALVCFLTGDVRLMLATFVPPALVATAFVGPSLAMLHNRVAPPLRPAASALCLAIVNLIGLGLGPALVGALSQYAFRAVSPNSLGYAMAAMQAIGLWGSLHFLIAARRLNREPASIATSGLTSQSDAVA